MSLIIPNFKDVYGQSLENLPEVALAKMLRQADEPVQLAFLQQSYTLNRGLQSTGLQNVPYWNAFDDLQQVRELSGLPLTIYDFSLSDKLEPFFINSSNQIFLYQKNELKMKVHVRNQVEVERIIHFLPGNNKQIDNYDDRGFLSTSVWINPDNYMEKMQWFTPFHEVVAEMDIQGKVVITPQFYTKFLQKDYQNLNQLVEELYQQHFKLPQTVIAAFRSGADRQNLFYLSLPASEKIALLDQDVSMDKISSHLNELQSVKWVFPSQILENQFLSDKKNKLNKLDTITIEPYPTTFTLGTSNEFEAQLVYWQFLHQGLETISHSLQQVFPLLLKNEKLVLLLDGSLKDQSAFLSFAKQWITNQTGVNPDGDDYQRYFEIGKPQNFSTEAEWMDYLDEHITDEEEMDFDVDQIHQFYKIGKFLSRIQVIDDETNLSDVFSKVRLFIDQGPQADLRKQILSISSGVPIISFAPTDLVLPKENGFQATTTIQLPQQINYFLDDLNHWNQGLIASVELIEKYEVDQLLQRWKGVISDG